MCANHLRVQFYYRKMFVVTFILTTMNYLFYMCSTYVNYKEGNVLVFCAKFYATFENSKRRT